MELCICIVIATITTALVLNYLDKLQKNKDNDKKGD